jgi:hypothetical protein
LDGGLASTYTGEHNTEKRGHTSMSREGFQPTTTVLERTKTTCVLHRVATGRDNIRRPFEKFVDSPYYSESELCGGAVTVSFSKYLPWQATYFLQRSIYFSKMCCRPFITSKFLTSELPFHGWKSPEISWGEIWTVWRMF